MPSEAICRYDDAHNAESVPASAVVTTKRGGRIPCCQQCAKQYRRTTYWEDVRIQLWAVGGATVTAAFLLILGVHILFVIAGAVGVYGYFRKST